MATRYHTAAEAVVKKAQADRRFERIATAFGLFAHTVNVGNVIGQFDLGKENKTLPFQKLKPLIEYAYELIQHDLFQLPYELMYASSEVFADEVGRRFDDCYLWSISDNNELSIMNVGIVPKVNHVLYGGILQMNLKTAEIIGANIIIDGSSKEEHARFICQRVLCITALLSSPSVQLVTTKAPKFLNRKRQKQGRPPIGDVHEVRIMLDGKRYSAGGDPIEPSGSKRAHWRRGHVRRLSSGAITNVRPCLVAFSEGEKVPQTLYKVSA